MHLLPRKNKEKQVDLFGEYTIDELVLTMERMLGTILRMQDSKSKEEIESCLNSCNFCVTDGNVVVASRYRNTNHYSQPPTLFYFEEDEKLDVYKSFTKINLEKKTSGTVISSEPLTDDITHWKLVPKNHIVAAKKMEPVQLIPISIGRRWIRRVLYSLCYQISSLDQKCIRFLNMAYQKEKYDPLSEKFLCFEDVSFQNFFCFGENFSFKNPIEQIKTKLIEPFKEKLQFETHFFAEYPKSSNCVSVKVEHKFLFENQSITFPILYQFTFLPKSKENPTKAISSLQFFVDTLFLQKNILK